MYEFSYHRAGSVEEAAEKKTLVSQHGEAKYLGGGMTLLATMKSHLASPSDLIDLAKIESLKGIEVAGNKVKIGAATTHFEVANDAGLQKACAGLANLAAHIGDAAVRHCGTIGGSLANNDPAADYPAGILALGAEIITNEKTHKADDFFTGLFETALGENEIITGIEFEVPQKACYAKFPNPASRYAMAGVFVAKTNAGANGGIRVAVSGAGADGVYRANDMEAALAKEWSANVLDSCVQDEGKMLGDIHATKSYRAHLVQVMAKRAVECTC